MVTVREVTEGTRPWVRSVLGAEWRSVVVVRPGRAWEDVSILDGFVAEVGGIPVSLALWEVHPDENEIELVVLTSVRENVGGGAAVTQAVVDLGRARGLRRAVVFTTNDNVHALRFYQRHGWDLVALYANSMDDVRFRKPDVPVVGLEGIPLRHMLELEIAY